jgi:hypothetical protein
MENAIVETSTMSYNNCVYKRENESLDYCVGKGRAPTHGVSEPSWRLGKLRAFMRMPKEFIIARL